MSAGEGLFLFRLQPCLEILHKFVARALFGQQDRWSH